MVEKVLKAMGSQLPFPRAPPSQEDSGTPSPEGLLLGSLVKEIIKNCGGSETVILFVS